MRLVLWLAALSACGPRVADDCKQPLPQMNTTSEVDVMVDLAAAETTTLAWGINHGMNYFDPVDRVYTDAIVAKLDALRLRAWRVAGTKNADGTDAGFGAFHRFITDYSFPARAGTRVTFNLQEIVGANHGKPMRVGACKAKARDCWVTFDGLRKTWNAELEAFLAEHCNDAGIDYFELTSEPEFHSFEGVSYEQLYVLMLDLYRLVKACKPEAKIVGPATVGWNQRLMSGLATFMAKNDMHLDAVSWHEFGDDAVPRYSPSALPAHVAAARALFGATVELHVNEYANAATAYSPGHALRWLAALEAERIDFAFPGCWDVPHDGRGVSNCWDDFTALFMPAPSTDPQAAYWLYAAWGALGTARVRAEATPAELSVIAGPLSERSAGVLIGNGGITRTEQCHYSGVVRTVSTSLVINNVPATTARVSLRRISSHAADVIDLDAVNVYGVARPTEPAEELSEVAIAAGRLVITLPSLPAGDVFALVVSY